MNVTVRHWQKKKKKMYQGGQAYVTVVETWAGKLQTNKGAQTRPSNQTRKSRGAAAQPGRVILVNYKVEDGQGGQRWNWEPVVSGTQFISGSYKRYPTHIGIGTTILSPPLHRRWGLSCFKARLVSVCPVRIEHYEPEVNYKVVRSIPQASLALVARSQFLVHSLSPSSPNPLDLISRFPAHVWSLFLFSLPSFLIV